MDVTQTEEIIGFRSPSSHEKSTLFSYIKIRVDKELHFNNVLHIVCFTFSLILFINITFLWDNLTKPQYLANVFLFIFLAFFMQLIGNIAHNQAVILLEMQDGKYQILDPESYKIKSINHLFAKVIVEKYSRKHQARAYPFFIDFSISKNLPADSLLLIKCQERLWLLNNIFTKGGSNHA